MARRANGEGSIYQRPNGLWQGQLTLPKGADGKARRLSVYGDSKREVRDKLDELIKQQVAGIDFEGGRKTVSEHFATWLDTVIRPNRAPNTLLCYSDTIRRYIDPYIGGVDLSKLTAAHVQSVLSTLEKKGQSERVRQLTHAVLRAGLNQAQKWKLIPWNPVDGVEAPRVKKKDMRFWTAEQAKAFVEAAKNDRLYALYVVTLRTSARQGEILGLKRGDVDLVAGKIRIHKNLVEQKGRILTTSEFPDGRHPVKSARSNRTISISKDVVAVLKQHYERLLAEGLGGSKWVFPNRHGGPYLKSALTKQFKDTVERAGVPMIRFHDLRHTSATLMITAGVDIKTVSGRLGHATAGFTLDTYAKFTEAGDRSAADKLEEVLK